jgi:hypothetical protein
VAIAIHAGGRGSDEPLDSSSVEILSGRWKGVGYHLGQGIPFDDRKGGSTESPVIQPFSQGKGVTLNWWAGLAMSTSFVASSGP